MRYHYFTGMIAAAVIAMPVQAQQQQRGPSVNDSSKTLAKGTKVEAKTTGEISSRTNHIGDMVPAVVVEDVRDGTGMVIVPKGSPATVEITDIMAPDKNHPNGVLQVAVKSVDVNGQTFRTRNAEASAGKKPGWSLFKKNDAPKPAGESPSMKAPPAVVGIVADPKGKVVGTDLVLPSGSAVTFDLGNGAVTLVAS